MDVPKLVISVVFYWTVALALLGFAIFRFKSTGGHKLAAAAGLIAAYLIGAAIFPVIAAPLVIVSSFTNIPFYPFTSRILVLSALSHRANQSLLERNDIRVLTIEYRFAIDRREQTFLTTLRCAKRYGVFGEFAEWQMREMDTAIGGELTGTLSDTAITVHGVPDIKRCQETERLGEGAQRTPL
jgi:hypothetical protein